MMREKVVKIGNRYIGGGFPVAIQSMCNTKTENVEATVSQILRLEDAGCEIVRVAVPTLEAAHAIKQIRKQIHIPLVADIHFDYRLAVAAMENGVDKIRLNPGNIGSKDRVTKVIELAKDKGIPIRIGVNGGSLDKELYQKHGGVTPEALVESAMRHISILDELNFNDIVISLKASDIKLTVESYRLLSKTVDYPLHLGITEAGTNYTGTVKSAIGIGILLYDGIGSTIRVSLTDDPVEEVKAAKKILEVLELRHFGVKIISCPTCGRTEVDLVRIAKLLEERVAGINKQITLAVMGCAVNGPGEAKEADLGIAGGKNEFLLFKKGLVIKKLKEDEVVEAVLSEIESM
ncbi:flavodoxin-dependent (E)-4-hydroxy-3-methylbut-2-enyl-diphosphate synthase [Fusibacter bizertensis]|uniref:4-hydroxy-3-methylbut-2-en-1-yl diphosphate synthase (flavodoxin) n=2 Tax=Fusibacter bizertensis TaxID=1488331 RepID=A0ABT6N853_9FIRM|nr:flavodoxin-dependent (E)-4-hydroxy-3-methylbut-2-enyl-diphosphate synthase [Fusibacter bizertensis]MDH8676591.1 flavodoxin-dependent (E)-4-hydroxy-3-methylbut-2-enyl-diphosphate synthase [Fusibacter bizertensis]